MSRNSVRLISAAAFALAAACVSLPAVAGDMEDRIEAREKTMKALGGGMKVVSEYMKDEKDINDLRKAAAAIAAAAAKDPATVFPKGTQFGVGDSHVKPELWAEWDKAEALWKSLGPAAGMLTAVAESGQKADVAIAMRGLGGACKTCHEAYRIKKD